MSSENAPSESVSQPNQPTHEAGPAASARRKRRTFLLALALFPTAAVALCVFMATRKADADNAGSDLPGYGVTVQPRVMILFDTSDSMTLSPSDTNGSLSYPTDDYTGPSVVNCRNRVCIGKKVLSQILPSYADTISFGLAHYFQYDTTTITTSGGASATASCTYDILEAAGVKETVNIDMDIGGSPDEWDCGNDYSCTNVTTLTPRLCVKVSGPNANGYLYSSDGSGNPMYFPPVTWTSNTGATFTPSAGGTTLGTSNFKGPHAGSGHYNAADLLYPGQPNTNTPTYTLNTVNTDPSSTTGTYYEVLATGSGTARSCPSDGTPTVHNVGDVWSGVTSPTAPAGGWVVNTAVTSLSGCSTYNPCTFYFHAIRSVVELNQQWCQYQRQRYYYYAPYWSYQWTTKGGEYVSNTTVATGATTNLCSSLTSNNNAYTGIGASNNLCPAQYTGSTTCTSPAGRQCVLKWRTSEVIGTTTYKYGRTTPYGANAGSATYCPSPDEAPQAPASPPTGFINEPNPNLYPADWCNGTNPTSVTSTTTVTRYADYYDPTNRAGNGIKGLMQAWSGVPTSYTGTAPTQPYNRAPYPSPSQTPGSPPYYMAPSLTFVDLFGVTTPTTSMTNISNALLAYNATSNSTGLWVPYTCTSGCSEAVPPQDVTPLYGSIAGATFYLQQQLANDADSACRRYYLMILTDGLENTPANYQASDLQTAINNLHTLTASNGNTANVDTFVIGFGSLAAGSSLTNIMAQAGGTAEDANGNVDLVNGSAFSALNSSQLQAAITSVLSTVAAGTYTRSSPVLTPSGNRVYIGYFGRQTGLEEWQGMMDAYNISTTGSYTHAWQFGAVTLPPELSGYTNLNNQASRTIYTTIDTTTGVIPFLPSTTTTATTAQQNTLNTLMAASLPGGSANNTGSTTETGPSADNVVINFMYNMSNTAKFNQANQTKASRLSDVYHSIPILVGTPPHTPNLWGTTTAEQTSYAAFQTAYNTNNTPTGLPNPESTLYTGANDGMVHAVREDAETTPATWAGSERWAFVPKPVLPELYQMLNGHQFTVDGNFMADDICTGACAAASDWHTLLLTSLRDGGAAITALDVSKSTSTTPTKPTWYWDFLDGNLGATYSTPAMGRLKVNISGTATNKWVTIVGGGYSTDVCPTSGGACSTPPVASNPPSEIADQVYVIDSTTGNIITDGTTNAKFLVDMALGSGAPYPYPTLDKNNVAGEIAVFRPNDNAFVSQAYFGTTQGRIYGMYFSSPAVASWKPAAIFDPYSSACEGDVFGHTQAPIEAAATGTVVSNLPLTFTSTPPPFFARPIVAFDVQGRAMLFMGTGDSTNPASTTEPTNYFYALRDTGTGTACSADVMWVKQFATNEKVVSAPVVVNGTIIISTYTPPASGLQCTANGNATLYAFDAVYGTPVNALTQVNADGTAKAPVVNAQGVSVPQVASSVTIQNRGVLSDLTVANNNLVYVTEIAPTSEGSGTSQTSGASSLPLYLPQTPVKIMSWRRKN
jgi:hypothetical protein